MNKIKNIGLIALVVVIGLATMNFSTTVDGYTVGDTVADFSLKNVDNSMVSLSNYEDAKGFLIVFTCNTCPFAVAYEDRVIALDAKYKALGVPVIAINPNNPDVNPADNFDAMKVRAKNKGFTFPYLLDQGQQVYPQFGATRTPHIFLLEKTNSGNVVRYIGAIDDNYQDASQVEEKFVENAVNAMLQGNEIEVKTTKAIGCTIKV